MSRRGNCPTVVLPENIFFFRTIDIFILPPSMRVLKQRLINRKTESKEVITRRLDRAKDEISSYKGYDYVIINDKLEKAYRGLESIIISERLKTKSIDHKKILDIIK